MTDTPPCPHLSAHEGAASWPCPWCDCIRITDESDKGVKVRNEPKKDDEFSQLDAISEEIRKQWEKELDEEFGDPGKVVVTTKYNSWTKEKFEMFLRRYVTDNQPIRPNLDWKLDLDKTSYRDGNILMRHEYPFAIGNEFETKDDCEEEIKR
jgi:hypothetical protein